jgi:hypothetical protein
MEVCALRKTFISLSITCPLTVLAQNITENLSGLALRKELQFTGAVTVSVATDDVRSFDTVH